MEQTSAVDNGKSNNWKEEAFLNIAHINVRSLRYKVDDIKLLLETHHIVLEVSLQRAAKRRRKVTGTSSVKK